MMNQAMPAILAQVFVGTNIRVSLVNGVPWYVLDDVCRALAISNPSAVAARLDDSEQNREIIFTAGGPQEMITINESGLYSVILTSRKPAAKRFERWLFDKVLPSLVEFGVEEDGLRMFYNHKSGDFRDD